MPTSYLGADFSKIARLGMQLRNMQLAEQQAESQNLLRQAQIQKYQTESALKKSDLMGRMALAQSFLNQDTEQDSMLPTPSTEQDSMISTSSPKQEVETKKEVPLVGKKTPAKTAASAKEISKGGEITTDTDIEFANELGITVPQHKAIKKEYMQKAALLAMSGKLSEAMTMQENYYKRVKEQFDFQSKIAELRLAKRTADNDEDRKKVQNELARTQITEGLNNVQTGVIKRLGAAATHLLEDKGESKKSWNKFRQEIINLQTNAGFNEDKLLVEVPKDYDKDWLEIFQSMSGEKLAQDKLEAQKASAIGYEEKNRIDLNTNYEKKMNESSEALDTTTSKMNELIGALTSADTGALRQFVAPIVRLLPGAANVIDPQGEYQDIEFQLRNYVVQVLLPMFKGPTTDFELNFMKGAIPSAGSSPEAIKKFENSWKRLSYVNKIQKKAYIEFRNKTLKNKGRLSDFNTTFSLNEQIFKSLKDKEGKKVSLSIGEALKQAQTRNMSIEELRDGLRSKGYTLEER